MKSLQIDYGGWPKKDCLKCNSWQRYKEHFRNGSSLICVNIVCSSSWAQNEEL
jgi:hypothetical protein